VAKVSGFSEQTIRDYKHVIDFYYWKGIPCARKWPDRSTKKPGKAQRASIAAFTLANQTLKKLTPHLREYWASLCVGVSYAWPDEFRGKFMKSWAKTKEYPQVMYDFEDLGDI